MWKISCKRLFLLATSISILLTSSCIILNTYQTSNHEYKKQYVLYSQKPQSAGNNSLIDLQNFNYIINNAICSTKNIYLLILIHSAPQNVLHRNLIRTTWGAPGIDVPIKVVFLMAASRKFQQDIEDENILHHDIVQGNFVDSYHNLTYKHVMGLQWASENCLHTRLILKMDDDIFIDIYQFLNYVKTHLKKKELQTNIACYFQTGMPVVRDPVSKWFVSKEEFTDDTFDNYCSGWAYLTTPHVASVLSKEAKKLPYFWVDDVHITGSVAKLASIGHIKMNNLFALETDGLVQWSRSTDNILWNKMFAPTWGNFVLSRIAHKKARHCYIEKCQCCFAIKTTVKPTLPSTTVKGEAKLLLYYFDSHKQGLTKRNFHNVKKKS